MPSVDDCLKEYPGYYLELTLPIKSGCMVWLTIASWLTVEREVMHGSKWIHISTLSYKIRLGSISSICWNIQHVTQHQRQRKWHSAMFRKCTFCLFCRANTANHRSGPPNYIIKRIKANVAWKQTESQPTWHWAVSDEKTSLWLGHNEKRTS